MNKNSKDASPHFLWQIIEESKAISDWQGAIVRVVESQQRIATLHLVDSLEEQAVLEQLIDGVKPSLPAGHESYHYLISSPFRYPPLRYGSRFGTRYAPSLFYASLTLQCALAECAYYRFVFLQGMSEPIPDPIHSEHSSFNVNCHAKQAIDLTAPPADGFCHLISHPSEYNFSQSMGSLMREAGVQLIHYTSARYIDGVNVGVFDISAIKKRAPYAMQYWRCVTHADALMFTLIDQKRRALEGFSFQRSDFLDDNNRLPMPAQ